MQENGFKEVKELRYSEMRDKKTSLAKAPSKTTVIPVITSIVLLSMFNITDDVTNAWQVLQPLSSVQTAPSQVHNFSHCNAKLNIARIILQNQVSARINKALSDSDCEFV